MKGAILALGQSLSVPFDRLAGLEGTIKSICKVDRSAISWYSTHSRSTHCATTGRGRRVGAIRYRLDEVVQAKGEKGELSKCHSDRFHQICFASVDLPPKVTDTFGYIISKHRSENQKANGLWDQR